MTMFGTTKKDLKSKQYKKMREYQETHDNLPDGAYFQLAEDMYGWTHEDWGWFYEVDELSPF